MSQDMRKLATEACSRLIRVAIESMGVSFTVNSHAEAVEFMSRMIQIDSDELCGAIARVSRDNLEVFTTIIPTATSDKDELDASIALFSRLHASLVQFRCLCQLKGALDPSLTTQENPFFPFLLDAEGEVILREWLYPGSSIPKTPVDLIGYASTIAPVEA